METTKILGQRECSNCGILINIYHKKRLEYDKCFCSKKCRGVYLKNKSNSDINVTCKFCGKGIHKKPSQLNKNKNSFCSSNCYSKYNKTHMIGSLNHQYGLLGNLNKTWKSDEKITNYGYKKIRIQNHPFKDCNGFVFEHRLVAEKFLLTKENSIEINNKKYLKKDYVVHHKDENKLNNSVDNLSVMKKSEHTKFHNKNNIINKKRDELGRFIN